MEITVIDVRTPGEFAFGNVAGSINIPLNELVERQDEILAMGTRVIFCCASGARSGQATAYFRAQGLNCENGGCWLDVNGMINC